MSLDAVGAMAASGDGEDPPPVRLAAAATSPAERVFDPRTRRLIEGPIVATLPRRAAPDVLVMLVQASLGLIEIIKPARE